MLSTLVHIKDKNELENHCAFCFFISIKSGVWLVTILTLSVTEGFEMGSCAPASPDPPNGCLPLVLLSAACQDSERVPNTEGNGSNEVPMCTITG